MAFSIDESALSLHIYICIAVSKKRRYKIQCARRVSGATSIKHTQGQKTEKPNKKSLWASKLKLVK